MQDSLASNFGNFPKHTAAVKVMNFYKMTHNEKAHISASEIHDLLPELLFWRPLSWFWAVWKQFWIKFT